MSRRSPHIDFRIWFPLAAFSLFALVLPVLADSGPCNCGNGKPCLANQMYFGYYPTVWRQWPGNCAEPQPANTAPGNQQIPNVEPPPPGQEFETRSFVPAGTSNTAPAPVPGSTPAPVPGGTGIEPFSPGIPAERERPGAVLPPPAVNPPAINPPLGLPSNDPQQLNQLLPTTSPQAFAPANEPNRIPAGNFPPISAYVEPSASIQGNWPPLNTVRAPETTAVQERPGLLPAAAPTSAALKPASDPNFSYDAVDGPEADGPRHADFRKPTLPELSPPQAAAPQQRPATIVAPRIASEPAPPVRLPPVGPTSGYAAAPWPMAVATPRSNVPAALPAFVPAAARFEAGPPVARQIADSGMSAPIIVNDSGCSKISGINPLTIDATPGDSPEPKMSRLPGDNQLSGDPTRVTDISDALDSGAGDHREPARAQAAAHFEAGGMGDVRQTNYLVRQPSGESNSLMRRGPAGVEPHAHGPARQPCAGAVPRFAAGGDGHDCERQGPIRRTSATDHANALHEKWPSRIRGGESGFDERRFGRLSSREPNSIAERTCSNCVDWFQRPAGELSPAVAPIRAPAARTAVPSNAAQPIAEQANSAGNPLRPTSSSSAPNVSTLVTGGIESLGNGAAGSQSNPLR